MKASTPESGFIVNLNAEQKELFKIAQKYGWNRQKLLDNAQKEIDKAGLGITKDTLRKRFDRLSERFNTYNAALSKDENVPQYPQDKEDPVEDRKESENTYLKKQLNSLRAENNKLRVRSYVATELADALKTELTEVEYDKFYINVKKANDGENHLVLPISDAHYGEVVPSASTHGINEYNPDISKARHLKLFEKALEMARDNKCGTIDILMLGDLFSGNIHDELKETNAGPLTKLLVDYFKFIVGAFKSLKNQFKKMNVYCVVGNHSRTNQKWQAKNKAYDNYEYILYKFIEEAFAEDPTVSIHVSEAPSDIAVIGEQKWKIEHGDAYRGGGAFCSPISTVTRDNFKDYGMFMKMGIDFDVAIMGHWHRGGEWFLSGKCIPVFLNPSIVGPNEYSIEKLHETFPASSYIFVTNGKEITSQTLFMLQ
jgi:hypothetical protein